MKTLLAPARSTWRFNLSQGIRFGWLELRACIFAVAVFATLAVSHKVTLGLPRYDFIFLALILVQCAMSWSKLETLEEIIFITIFHLVGFVLEQFKTHVGSWAYPEFGYTKIAGVPLYSGFMYAAVGSYIAQSWRLLQVRLEREPNPNLGWGLGGLIYLNFFSNHFLPDFRFPLMAGVILLYWRTQIWIRLRERSYWMPLPLVFVGAGFLIWIAENIATFYGAWVYPNQRDGWHLVDFSKITSWMLLVIISFILVHHLKRRHASKDQLLEPQHPEAQHPELQSGSAAQG